MIRTCKFCKSEFEVKYKSDTRQYCSKACANQSPERANKISQTRKVLLNTKGGQEMYRQAMKKRNKLPYYQRREGKRTRERDIVGGRTEYREWRKAVLRRDKWTCQECGKVGGILQAHHIRSWEEYPELRFDVGNGKTLCPDCHTKIHGFTVLPLKTCPICNNKFRPHQMKQVCCSSQCAGKKRSQDAYKDWTKTCKQCGKDFRGYTHRTFCSNACYYESLRCIEDKPCEFCGKVFSPHTKETKYCSRECYGAATSEATKKVCPVCLSRFSPARKRQVCCSKACADKIRNKPK